LLIARSDGLTNLFNSLQSGKIYYPQFYVVGFYYLLVLLLGGFQDKLERDVSFSLLFFITVTCTLFIAIYIKFIINKCKSPTGTNSSTISKLLNKMEAKHHSIIFVVICFIEFIITLNCQTGLSKIINSEFIQTHIKNCEVEIILFSFFPMFFVICNFVLFQTNYEKHLSKNISNIGESEDWKAVQGHYNVMISSQLSKVKVMPKPSVKTAPGNN
jgi:hypothetical protein